MRESAILLSLVALHLSVTRKSIPALVVSALRMGTHNRIRLRANMELDLAASWATVPQLHSQYEDMTSAPMHHN